MSTKKKHVAVNDSWISFEGDFSTDDQRAAVRSEHVITKLSVTKTTRFTQRRALDSDQRRALESKLESLRT